ncbi:MAG: hypothetical protein HY927_03780 [Elusimicrobia bacterium]|nr:hypothetical protein [Elusimicrobiota bacterium]
MRARISLLPLMLLLGAPGWAARTAALPDPVETLARGLAGPSVSYDGTVSVRGAKGRSKKMRVRCAPPACRREIVDSKGAALLVVVTDGAREWVFDKRLNKVWQGAGPGSPEEGKAYAAHYRIAVSTGGRVAGRPSWRVELSPKSGVALRRRLWIDREQGLILRDESYLPDGTTVSKSRYSRVAYGVSHDAGLFAPDSPAGALKAGRLDMDDGERSRARESSGLEPKTPAWLPSGYVLEGVELVAHRDKKIVHYRYSDGVHALSLFQSPPRARLDLGTKDRRDVRLAAGAGFASWSDEGGVLGWTQGETRLVMVAPLGIEALERIAESVR